MNYQDYAFNVASAARQAAREVASLSSEQKNRALEAMAAKLEESEDEIRGANRLDLAAGKESGLSGAMLDRLEVTPERLAAMARGLREVAGLPDPVGRVIDRRTRPNGMEIERVRIPIGVIGIIYESRPNVTVDSAGLCLKAGNAVILRGGKEAINTNPVLAGIMKRALEETAVPPAAIQMVDITDREVVGELLKLDELVDLIIPRGGEGLIRAVVENSRIPVIKHYKGVCHIYVAASADKEMALEIVDNSKTQRPGVCNALETLLVDRTIAPGFLPAVYSRLQEKGVELRGCPETRKFLSGIAEASEEDWSEEYLDLILAVRVVAGVKEAIEHIARYGSEHTEAIITGDRDEGEEFLKKVDSSSVFVNLSTRFSDGGQFGLGAEIGISTDKLHARGPMGLEELTTYKWVGRGGGQIRQ